MKRTILIYSFEVYKYAFTKKNNKVYRQNVYAKI